MSAKMYVKCKNAGLQFRFYYGLYYRGWRWKQVSELKLYTSVFTSACIFPRDLAVKVTLQPKTQAVSVILPTCLPHSVQKNVHRGTVKPSKPPASRLACHSSPALTVILADYTGKGHTGSPKSTSSIPPYPCTRAAVGSGKRLFELQRSAQ